MKIAIYLDKVSDVMREFMQEFCPLDVHIYFWTEMSTEEQESILSQAEYLMNAIFVIDEAFLQKAPNVKMVLRTGVGLDNVSKEATQKRGIIVTNARGINSNCVAEMTIGMILCLYRKLCFFDKRLKSGHWDIATFRAEMYEMRGKTHGFIGMGNIGKRTAELSRVFGTKGIYYNRTRLSEALEQELNLRYVSLQELIEQSDIITLHVALTEQTRGLIGEKELACMKPNAIIINTARGHIIDEKALAKALEEKRILGAGIDTFTKEPVEKDNPLLQLDNFVGTPHEGAGSRDTLKEIVKTTLENIHRHIKGEEPVNIVFRD